ncbi:MAG: shikimate kinase [Chloroflexi bacterium]|nr:MAG: shikimate kinase [Chloroflexota bacterium]TMF39236.1 MAG: shikimate kinase [Chloroflexota bacterium]
MDVSKSTPPARRAPRSSTTCPGRANSAIRFSCSRRGDGAARQRHRLSQRPCRRTRAASSYRARKPLALLGFMGSGKTLVGALVAERSRAPFSDLDLMVEDRAGMPIADIFAVHSEEVFRSLEKELLPRALKPGAVVALGGGVVIDDDNWALISDQATTVYLEAPFATIWSRIAHLPGRPLMAGRTRWDVEELFERRRSRYEQAEHRVDASREPDAIADEVMKLWSA